MWWGNDKWVRRRSSGFTRSAYFENCLSLYEERQWKNVSSVFEKITFLCSFWAREITRSYCKSSAKNKWLDAQFWSTSLSNAAWTLQIYATSNAKVIYLRLSRHTCLSKNIVNTPHAFRSLKKIEPGGFSALSVITIAVTRGRVCVCIRMKIENTETAKRRLIYWTRMLEIAQDMERIPTA